MPAGTAEGMSSVQDHERTSWLLQLPEAALASVLQKLDQCSLVSTALACTAVSNAVPGNLSTAVMSCTRPVRVEFF
jgi:hypothetical protein